MCVGPRGAGESAGGGVDLRFCNRPTRVPRLPAMSAKGNDGFTELSASQQLRQCA